MTFVSAITAVSERFLRERTFDLAVAPAIADVEYAMVTAGLFRRTRLRLALISTLFYSAWEDATSDSGALTFAALTLIPACYYSLMAAICMPRDSYLLSTPAGRASTAAIILVLSLGPAIACYWPERPSRRVPADR
jgi:hypothetical protein